MMNAMPPAAPIRVLIVDDHPSMLWGLEKLIGSAAPHLEVAGAAACPESAMTILERSAVDVALLDVELGDDCGLDMIPAIGKVGARVIMLSGTRDFRIRRKAIAAGARGFISKTTGIDEILKAIPHVAQGHLWLQSADISELVCTPGTGGLHERDQLTAAELRVVSAVVSCRNASNKAIADTLHISTHTLRNHLAAVYGKLDIHSRLELVFYAQKHLARSIR